MLAGIEEKKKGGRKKKLSGETELFEMGREAIECAIQAPRVKPQLPNSHDASTTR